MKKIDVDELKKIQLQILDSIDSFCRLNNIEYWMDCGTLLGAVRHKGYIPWDDDIDIGMDRNNFDKFSELFNSSNNRYRFISTDKSHDYTLALAKVIDTNTVLYEPDKNGRKLAVYVDVFVYDNASDNDKEVKKSYRIRNYYRKLNIAHTQNKDYIGGNARKFLFKILHFMTIPFPKNYFAIKMVENSKKYCDIDTKRVGNFTGYDVILADKTLLNSFIDIEFEGKKYRAPLEYDKWLKLFYGDYMVLPPIEKRVSHHIFEAYYLDK